MSEDGWTALAERGRELDAVRAELQGLIVCEREACDTLLPLAPPEAPHDLVLPCDVRPSGR